MVRKKFNPYSTIKTEDTEMLRS